MSRWILLAWLTIVAPFATLPWFTIAQDQDQVDAWWQSHLSFHLAYVPFVLAGAYVGWRVATAAASRWVRRLAWIVVALQLVGFVGHAGELVAVLRNGAFDAGEDVSDLTAHALFGSFTPIALMLSIALVIAITLVAARNPDGRVGSARPASEPAV